MSVPPGLNYPVECTLLTTGLAKEAGLGGVPNFWSLVSALASGDTRPHGYLRSEPRAEDLEGSGLHTCRMSAVGISMDSVPP